jgi:predicted dehydrogenase
MQDNLAGKRKVRLGMIGGGPGSNIGETHRYAARIDNRYELVTGVFATDPQRSQAFAAQLGLAPHRRYASWEELIEQEAARRARGEEAAEAVAIVTPNNSHYAIAKACLEHGLHVICDKPLTTELSDAEELAALADKTGLVFGLTHNYTGYPMVRHARAMIAAGELGEIRLVQVEHASGWAATLLEAEGHKQAVWRTTPAIAGKSSVVGDLGTHAHNLARFITGLEVTEVAAELATIVAGRQVDDNAHILLRFANGAKGMLWASMVATGNTHGLRIRVYGTAGSIEWVQENANELRLQPANGPHQILTRGAAYLSPAAQHASRLWPGHPEGFLEAFANIYNDVADVILAQAEGVAPDPLSTWYPTVHDGVLGVRFVDAAVASQAAGGHWIEI